MVVSDPVLSRIAHAWTKDGLFRSRYANIVGAWCVHHAAKYNGKAPGKAIQAYFETWAEESNEKEEIKLVESLLSTLSGEYSRLKKEINPDHVIDLAGDHFNRVSLEKLAEGIQSDLESGQVQKAAARRDKFKPIEMGAGEWIDVFRDEAAFEKVFTDKQEPLVTFRGDLGEFFDNAFERDSFVSIQGPEKSGKSYLLQEVCWQGVKQGRRVAMFQVGDLSQSQIMARFMVRAAGRPWGAKDDIRYPMSLTKEEDGYKAKYKMKATSKPMSRKIAKAAFDKQVGEESLFRLSCHPNTSITINGVNDYLERWDREGWVPDLVCIDYADILAPVSGTAESRDQINMTWKLMRRMSQDWHCCVLTATQTDAASYEASLIRRKNFSEDKRKYAHVTAFFGNNQTDDEKAKGLRRLNWLELREKDFVETKCVAVAGCLDVANPFIRSCW
jgi:hypothetical protein